MRLVRRSRLHTPALVFALLDLIVQSLIVILGLALVFSPDVLTSGFSLAPGQDWVDDVIYAIPLGFVAYTGLETVANLAEEAREPGRTLPRSLFTAIGLVVVLTVLVATVGVTAFPATDGTTELGDQWLEAPLVGIVTAFGGELPAGIVDVLRVAVGLSAALILLMAVTTSISGCTRLAHSMGTHGMLPRELGRLERRTLVSREAHRGDRDRRDRGAARLRRGHRPGALPRRHLLVRRAARVHAGAARRDQAPSARARPRTTVPCPTRRADPRRRRPAAGARRCAAHRRRVRDRARHARVRPLRRPRLARHRPRHLRDDPVARAGRHAPGRRPEDRAPDRRASTGGSSCR